MANTYGAVSENPAMTRGLKTAAEKDAAVRALISVAHDGGLGGIMEGMRSHDGRKAIAALDAHASLCRNAGFGYLDEAVAAGVADALLASCRAARDRVARRERERRVTLFLDDSEGDDSDSSFTDAC